MEYKIGQGPLQRTKQSVQLRPIVSWGRVWLGLPSANSHEHPCHAHWIKKDSTHTINSSQDTTPASGSTSSFMNAPFPFSFKKDWKSFWSFPSQRKSFLRIYFENVLINVTKHFLISYPSWEHRYYFWEMIPNTPITWTPCKKKLLNGTILRHFIELIIESLTWSSGGQ